MTHFARDALAAFVTYSTTTRIQVFWLECTCESGQGDSCGLSCHIECALQHGKVGVVELGQLMHLDGSYCCVLACGKVSSIIGFKELHEIVTEAKAKLETEVGPVKCVFQPSWHVALSADSLLQVMCRHSALVRLRKQTNLWLRVSVNPNIRAIEGSLPAACRFLFEEVTSSSVVILLIELSIASSNDIQGYKLWYCKKKKKKNTQKSLCVFFPRSQRRILITNLQPCTEYSFRIVSYTDAGDLGHSEAKCFTKSVEIIHKNPNSNALNHKKADSQIGGSSGSRMKHKNTTTIESDSGFKVRDLGKILRLAWAQEQGCFDGFCSVDIEKGCGVNKVKKETLQEVRVPSVSRELDLNVASVPDLNEEVIPHIESSRDEDNGCTFGQTVEADDAILNNIERNDAARVHGSGDSQNWNHVLNKEVPAVDSRAESCRKRAASTNEETFDCDSTLINGSPFRIHNESECLDENFEYCVKIIRWLECEDYIKKEFRLKLLTWFSLRSTEQERRVVNTFIQTLIDDPSSLAGQLVDSFSDIVSLKRPRNGFCSKLWH
ncbi:unnamed protein product [Ilex paraguariensis]|uniref:Fibronectin type-III domain-containing protein n=1 Tax=Ilex paraguariensis TaxID=185542 RepID=A0ABC8TXA0_9AQUA